MNEHPQARQTINKGNRMQNEVSQPSPETQEFSEKDIQRFWKFVNKSGPIPNHRPELGECWLWTGGRRPNGYGNFKASGRTISSHRMAFLIHNKRIAPGFLVCHSCDVHHCVNPAHLFAGTQKNNLDDMRSKGRENHTRTKRKPIEECHYDRSGRPGERNGRAVLCEDAVRSIRREYASGSVSYRVIAERFGLKPTAIARMIRRESWTHVI